MRAELWSTSSSAHVGRLEFSNPRKQAGYFVLTGTLALDGEEWSTDVEMIGVYLDDLLGFFADMAKHRGGWSGVMSWKSEFSDMCIDARNRGRGEVELDAVISRLADEDDRGGTLTVSIESVQAASEAMSRMFGSFVPTGRLVHLTEPATWRPLRS